MEKNARIYVAGHTGMVGGAVVRALRAAGYTNLLFRRSAEVDLRNQEAVNRFFEEARPQYIFLTAAKVGGIVANNTYRAEFLYDNLMIEANVIHAAYRSGTEKLLFLGSSCIYPKLAPQPMKEEYLLTGPLEITNEPYAVAKIAGIKLCETYREQYGCNFIAAMPTNLYGAGDNYHPQNSHVVAGLLRKVHEAKETERPEVEIWGSGAPLREFMFVDDLADACLFLMQNYSEKGFINVGNGEELSIRELAEAVKEAVGYTGGLKFDTSKPDGTPRKLMDSTRLRAMGWSHRTGIAEGLRAAYRAFLEEGDLRREV